MSSWLGSFFGGTAGGSSGNEFVGQNVALGQQKLRIKKVLGEGIYGNNSVYHLLALKTNTRRVEW